MKLRTLTLFSLLLAACGSTAGSQSLVGPEVLADAGDSGSGADFSDVGAGGDDGGAGDTGALPDTGSDGSPSDTAIELDTQVEDVADTGISDTGTADTTVTDTGTADTTVTDTGTADTTGGDTTTVDTTPTVCEPASTSCSGNVLLTCADDGSALGRTRCSSTAQICGTGPDGRFACIDPVCTPNLAYCVDAVTRGVCDANGAGPASTESCAAGCNATTGACNPLPGAGCTVEASTPIAVGDVITVDLCGAGDDVASIPGPNDCGSFATDDEDAIFELTLDAPATLLFDLQDADNTVAIDTLLYLRSTCDLADSQILCADDIDCASSDITTGCTGGVQPRQSQFQASLEPGTYYLIAEQFTRNSGTTAFGCGVVQLSVTPL